MKYFISFLVWISVLINNHEWFKHNSKHSDIINNMEFFKKKIMKYNNHTPLLLCEFSGIGNGYSSPVIAQNRIFVTGEIDSIGYLFAFELNGELFWKRPYGKEWINNYGGTRAAPTYADDYVYVCSAFGKICCFE